MRKFCCENFALCSAHINEILSLFYRLFKEWGKRQHDEHERIENAKKHVVARQPRFILAHYTISHTSSRCTFILFLGVFLVFSVIPFFLGLRHSIALSISCYLFHTVPLQCCWCENTWHCTQSFRAKRTMKINFKTTKTFITKLFIHFFSCVVH